MTFLAFCLGDLDYLACCSCAAILSVAWAAVLVRIRRCQFGRFATKILLAAAHRCERCCDCARAACTCNLHATIQRDPQSRSCVHGRLQPDQLANAVSAIDGRSRIHFWSASSCGTGRLRLLASVASALCVSLCLCRYESKTWINL